MTKDQKEIIIKIANDLIGTPYKYGATQEEAPKLFDCASFIRYLFKQINIGIGHTSILQAGDEKGKEIEIKNDLSNLEEGDLIFTRGRKGRYDDDLFDGRKIYVGHVAVYVGNGGIVHSRRRYGGVVKQSLQEIISDPDLPVSLIKRF